VVVWGHFAQPRDLTVPGWGNGPLYHELMWGVKGVGGAILLPVCSVENEGRLFKTGLGLPSCAPREFPSSEFREFGVCVYYKHLLSMLLVLSPTCKHACKGVPLGPAKNKWLFIPES
jgi:hypothetical protein